MKRILNLNKKSNKRCEHCAYYKIETAVRNKTSNNICQISGDKKYYYQTCSKFIWAADYISINNECDKYDSAGNILCRRCGKPLTDTESVARKFGETCYTKRLHQLKRRMKRLF